MVPQKARSQAIKLHLISDHLTIIGFWLHFKKFELILQRFSVKIHRFKKHFCLWRPLKAQSPQRALSSRLHILKITSEIQKMWFAFLKNYSDFFFWAHVISAKIISTMRHGLCRRGSMMWNTYVKCSALAMVSNTFRQAAVSSLDDASLVPFKNTFQQQSVSLINYVLSWQSITHDILSWQ